jgi:DNA gyrase subunit B
MSEGTKTTLSDRDIVVLNPLEHVRKRPGMYIGGINSTALHHLIYEIVDNSVELAFAKKCNQVCITLRPNNEVCIQDNGPGIPVEINQTFNKSNLEVIMTNIGVCGFRMPIDGDYPVYGGLHGIGLAAVNALSEWFLVENVKDGYLWKQEYREGKPQNEVDRLPLPENMTGVRFTFRPDFTILEANSFDYKKLVKRCHEISRLVAGLTMTVRDERSEPPIEKTFYTTEGLVDLLKEISKQQRPLHEPVSDRCKVRLIALRHASKPYTVVVDFALQFTDSMEFTVKSYVNTVETPDGGSHILALRSAVADAINYNAFDNIEENEEEYSPYEVSRGLSAVVHVMHPMPSFESPTKVKLLVPAELYGAVSEAVFRAVNDLVKDDTIAEKILEKCQVNRLALKSKSS